MWLVIFCFVFPAALFSLCGFLAWLRMWLVQRRRENKLFRNMEEQTRLKYESHQRSTQRPAVFIDQVPEESDETGETAAADDLRPAAENNHDQKATTNGTPSCAA
ncbi:hypothetical protein AAVH_21428 [Aphelenchoides avenae]|nr:hypothetical protein AAVH_21428 [Aphelenchus avenae]